ncbi:MAG: nucleotidyltransferase family protein [Bacillota bacterium]|nr:nucleotidyltransferase family protein [Bacillota bacterium]
MKISGIIMAAGLSTRMGTNKLFLDFKGQDLYKHVLDLVGQLDLDQVILVSSYEEILKEGQARAFTCVYNPNNQEGKAASIRLGVGQADPDSALMFFVADQPLLGLETCQRLIRAFENKDLVTFPKTPKRKGSPVIFPKSYRQALLSLKKDQGGSAVFNDQDGQSVLVENPEELWDIDSYDQYKSLKETYE